MKTFQQYIEDVAMDLGREIAGRGLSASKGPVLAHLLRAVRIAIASDPTFARRLLTLLQSEGGDVQAELDKSNMDDLNDSAFLSGLRTAAKSGLKTPKDEPDVVAPNASDMA